jgi:phage terminase large subunit GpA-like protein
MKHDAIRLRSSSTPCSARRGKTTASRSKPARARRSHAFPTLPRCPAGVAVLVRTVDTQGDRLETSVWGFGAGEEAWPIEHELIPGDPGIPEGSNGSPWNELAAIVDTPRTYRHASGTELKPSVTGIDAGGHHSKNVYAFTRKRVAQKVYALHGSTLGQGVPLCPSPRATTPRRRSSTRSACSPRRSRS